ncbi:QacE family quaternary ammonium compound efflux SMR transporter [Microbacteriaceae bacterium VKM Ac-2855]|nr:QacE family quaternary ammonium compound efflux SMR transporter [Microbacteriaceae bacterium VKM Ac-2855]
MKWVFLAGAIALEVTGSLALRAAVDTAGFFALVAIGYVGAFTLFGGALRQGMALGVGYGIWGAAGVALTAVLSLLIFGEPLSALSSVGIVILIGGVLCVELGSQAATEKPEGTG